MAILQLKFAHKNQTLLVRWDAALLVSDFSFDSQWRHWAQPGG